MIVTASWMLNNPYNRDLCIQVAEMTVHLLKMCPALSVLYEFKSVGFKIVIIMMTINII